MSNFGNYIYNLKKSNKALFKGGKISISPDSFEKELELAYNQGFKDAVDSKSIWEKVFGDAFNDVFDR